MRQVHRSQPACMADRYNRCRGIRDHPTQGQRCAARCLPLLVESRLPTATICRRLLFPVFCRCRRDGGWNGYFPRWQGESSSGGERRGNVQAASRMKIAAQVRFPCFISCPLLSCLIFSFVEWIACFIESSKRARWVLLHPHIAQAHRAIHFDGQR